MPHKNLHRLILLSILASLVTMVLRTAAYWLTGSVGLLSDAAESGVNLLAACTAFVSLWYSSRPVDASHTYGHEKIEFFSSGIEGLLILVAAIGIGWMALERLHSPQPLQSMGIGVALGFLGALVNLAVAKVLLRVGRQHQSIVLEADGYHLMTDFWTSIAIVVGVALVWLTGWQLLDPLFALAMACYITWTALFLLLRSFNGLMDHALPEAEQTVVRAAIEKQLQAGVTYHALRTRQAGARRFVDFHLLVPGVMSVTEAHQIANRIEASVGEAFPEVEVTVHIEPIEEPEAWQDSAVLKVEEAAARQHELGKGPGQGNRTDAIGD